MPHGHASRSMKKGILILTVFLTLVLVTGCLGGNSNPAPDGTTETSDGGADTDSVSAPEPYTDAEVVFEVNGSERGELAVEVVFRQRERNIGLMGRESLPNGTGMLFQYRDHEVDEKSFWMKNTLIPLDIIFVGPDMRVLNVEHADVPEPNTPDSKLPEYRSDGPAQYVVEAERGYANRTGISPGDRLIIRR